MVADPNLEQLEAVADALGPLLDELCLVGGCAAGLLITDLAASPVRPTQDVDLIVEAVTYLSYHRFCDRLVQRGFSRGGSEDPICRWRLDELIVDIMPLEESTLGFSNRWYKRAFAARQAIRLSGGKTIHCIDAPHFLATKLAAFESRGNGDFVASHDLEDFIRLLDGRPEVVGEVAASDEELRTYIATGVRTLMADRFFIEALPEYFDDGAGRSPIVIQRLERLASSA